MNEDDSLSCSKVKDNNGFWLEYVEVIIRYIIIHMILFLLMN